MSQYDETDRLRSHLRDAEGIARKLESENARLREERDAARKSALWLTELHTQAATEANERGATIERLRSRLSALREALQLARQSLQGWATHPDAEPYASWDPPHTIQDPNGTRETLASIDAALASTEPNYLERGESVFIPLPGDPNKTGTTIVTGVVYDKPDPTTRKDNPK